MPFHIPKLFKIVNFQPLFYFSIYAEKMFGGDMRWIKCWWTKRGWKENREQREINFLWFFLSVDNVFSYEFPSTPQHSTQCEHSVLLVRLLLLDWVVCQLNESPIKGKLSKENHAFLLRVEKFIASETSLWKRWNLQMNFPRQLCLSRDTPHSFWSNGRFTLKRQKHSIKLVYPSKLDLLYDFVPLLQINHYYLSIIHHFYGFIFKPTI